MSGHDKHAGSGASGMRTSAVKDDARKSSVMMGGVGRCMAAATVLAALMGSGSAASETARLMGSHVRFTSGEAHKVQIAAIIREEGRISVENEPLLHVIDELNRHSDRKVMVDRSDRRLRSLLVTGQFRTGRPESIIQYMRAAGLRLSTSRDRNGNIILRLLPDSSSG